MQDMSRRAFAIGAPLTLAGCATGGGVSILGGERGGYDPSAIYGSYSGEEFPVPAIPYQEIAPRFYRQIVTYANSQKPGTIVVDPKNHFLYHIRSTSTAVRYGVGVGREGFAWSGEAHIQRKAEWPRWTPPKEMQLRDAQAAKWADGMPGGIDNPLGARAMYLYQGDRDTEYRLHGTIEPLSIGKSMSSGCIRLLNQDVIDLYAHTPVGTKVIVL